MKITYSIKIHVIMKFCLQVIKDIKDPVVARRSYIVGMGNLEGPTF